MGEKTKKQSTNQPVKNLLPLQMNNKLFAPAATKYTPVLLLGGIAILVSVLTRFILLIAVSHHTTVTLGYVAGSFLIGLLFDVLISLFVVLPFILEITFTNNFIYSRKGRWVTLAGFLLIFIVLLFTSIVPKDYSRELYHMVILYLVLRLAIYLFLYTRSSAFRFKWRSAVLKLFVFLTIFILLFNAVSEWFFWDEFSSRYNFIAVDYLVYTNEVVGNIRESYPIFSILLAAGSISFAILLALRKPIERSVRIGMRFSKRIAITVVAFALAIFLAWFTPPQWKNFSKNNYVNELAGNGMYEFVQAFKNNKLDFYKYYQTIPDSTAFTIVRENLLDSNSRFLSGNLFDLERTVHYEAPEQKMNVVLISVESLSASFMEAFGNTQHITPHLDSLAQAGMLFTNLYASGTRTVRGLEALSLSLPPLPGESIVKRPGNGGLFSLGAVFKSKGYITQYIYGGYGYFDNMNAFFGSNSYETIDRTALSDKDIHYSNIWGVADEDLFGLALSAMDKNYAANQPFFSHVMTVSNHRPYTYPEGRIDIPPSTQSREGAVKYTDYSIGHFIQQASAKPWFSNTIFVIVADHCASSAGKQALPVTGYHIPMIIYSSAHISPRKITSLTAQVDIAPTLLGLLHFSYHTRFFGQDVLHHPVEKQRAFISTYQGLGFLKNDTLIVQSPVKKVNSYLPDFTTGDAKEIKSTDGLTNEAIAFYQVAAWLIKNKKYGVLEK
ncbi:MAG TPA: sulfatase-like hydrolase/transferase [Agriterribacter sp.]|nr:sulfatase-like hydrolase/transferase [Agriterribacter sp.]